MIWYSFYIIMLFQWTLIIVDMAFRKGGKLVMLQSSISISFHCSFLINLSRLVHDPKLSVRLYLGFSKVFFDEIIIFWLTSIVLLKFSFCFSNSTTTAAGPPAGCPTICIALYWCTSCVHCEQHFFLSIVQNHVLIVAFYRHSWSLFILFNSV